MRYAALILVCGTLLPSSSAVHLLNSHPLEPDFVSWQQQHAKTYSSEHEHLHRFSVWLGNLELVNAHNAEARRGLHTFRLGMNQFGDMTNDEYQRRMLGLRAPRNDATSPRAIATFRRSSQQPIPNAVDWRTYGIVTDVKDQGQCGSCWAFAAVSALEAMYNKAHNGTVDKVCTSKCGGSNACCSFSEQELVDCTMDGKDTCKVGGDIHDAFMEITTNRSGSIETEAQYPYTASSGSTGDK